MGNFGEDMMKQIEAFNNAKDAEEKGKTPKKSTRATYEVEASGIDMVVSRVMNGKCTMKMYVYLSQTNENGNGLIIIKSLKDGTMREATVDGINTFLRDLQGSQHTGSNAIPFIKSGKDFAQILTTAKDSRVIELIKEGLINTEMLGENGRWPWYVDFLERWHSTTGVGIKDRHAKLIRHMVETLAKRDNIEYHQALARTCQSGYRNYRYGGYDDTQSYEFVWSFSELADIFDEPYAKKCFDEYIDNIRLGGLEDTSISRFFGNLISSDTYGWEKNVMKYKSGDTIVTLEKNRFWEFLEHAVGVGLGKRLSSYLSLYADYLKQAHSCDGKVREKYPENLQVAHDVYTEKYNTIREFTDAAKLKERTEKGAQYIDQVHDDYQLKTLRTINEFYEEAQQNCNCVASYVDNVKTGRCWVASFRQVGAPTTQLTIEINPDGRMVQIKGKFNRDATEKEMNLLQKFMDGIKKNMEKKALEV